MSLLSFIDSEVIRVEVEKKFDQLKIPRDFGLYSQRLIPAVYRVLSFRPGTRERYHNDNWCIDCEMFATRYEGESDKEYSLRLRSVIGSAVPDNMAHLVPYLYLDEDAPVLGGLKPKVKVIFSKQAHQVVLEESYPCRSEVIAAQAAENNFKGDVMLQESSQLTTRALLDEAKSFTVGNLLMGLNGYNSGRFFPDNNVVSSEQESADEEVDDESSGVSDDSVGVSNDESRSDDNSNQDHDLCSWSDIKVVLGYLEGDFDIGNHVDIENCDQPDIGPVVCTLELKFPCTIRGVTCERDSREIESLSKEKRFPQRNVVAEPIVYKSCCGRCMMDDRCSICPPLPSLPLTDDCYAIPFDIVRVEGSDKLDFCSDSYYIKFPDERGGEILLVVTADGWYALNDVDFSRIDDFKPCDRMVVVRDLGSGARVYADSDEMAWEEERNEMWLQRQYYDDGDPYDWGDHDYSEEYSGDDYWDYHDEDSFADPPNEDGDVYYGDDLVYQVDEDDTSHEDG